MHLKIVKIREMRNVIKITKRIKISFLLSRLHIIYERLSFVPDKVVNGLGETNVKL